MNLRPDMNKVSSGFGVWGLGFGVWGSGFRFRGFKVEYWSVNLRPDLDKVKGT